VSKMRSMKDILGEEYTRVITWTVAFVGVCVLVGLGKIKPETIEYLLFAMGGAVASKRLLEPSKTKDKEDP
jgi:hypothetical protein